MSAYKCQGWEMDKEMVEIYARLGMFIDSPFTQQQRLRKRYICYKNMLQ